MLGKCCLGLCSKVRVINLFGNKHILTDADLGVPGVLDGVFVVEEFARLAVASHGVVLTVVTHPSAEVARGQIHRHVKVALGRVAVTVTLCKDK